MNWQRKFRLFFLALACALAWPHPQANAKTRRETTKEFHVVLVHGIYGDASALDKLQAALEARGYPCFCPTLRPTDARLGLEDLAHKLKTAVDRKLGPDEAIFLVAFSMGGLISRFYLEELGGTPRCRGLVTISTPHAGTITAYLVSGQGAHELHPGSPFLRRLHRDEATLNGLPITSCWNPLDVVIFPAYSSIWRGADNKVVLGACHPSTIRSPMVRHVVLNRLGRVWRP